jgi:hypothetical protein
MDDLHERDGWLSVQVRSHPGRIAHESDGTRDSGAGNGPLRTIKIKEAIHDHDQSGNARAGPD